jgi:hypothetical protein
MSAVAFFEFLKFDSATPVAIGGNLLWDFCVARSGLSVLSDQNFLVIN